MVLDVPKEKEKKQMSLDECQEEGIGGLKEKGVDKWLEKT